MFFSPDGCIAYDSAAISFCHQNNLAIYTAFISISSILPSYHHAITLPHTIYSTHHTTCAHSSHYHTPHYHLPHDYVPPPICYPRTIPHSTQCTGSHILDWILGPQFTVAWPTCRYRPQIVPTGWVPTGSGLGRSPHSLQFIPTITTTCLYTFTQDSGLHILPTTTTTTTTLAFPTMAYHTCHTCLHITSLPTYLIQLPATPHLLHRLDSVPTFYHSSTFWTTFHYCLPCKLPTHGYFHYRSDLPCHHNLTFSAHMSWWTYWPSTTTTVHSIFCSDPTTFGPTIPCWILFVLHGLCYSTAIATTTTALFPHAILFITVGLG